MTARAARACLAGGHRQYGGLTQEQVRLTCERRSSTFNEAWASP